MMDYLHYYGWNVDYVDENNTESMHCFYPNNSTYFLAPDLYGVILHFV